jgi:hypothetical protein
MHAKCLTINLTEIFLHGILGLHDILSGENHWLILSRCKVTWLSFWLIGFIDRGSEIPMYGAETPRIGFSVPLVFCKYFPWINSRHLFFA